MNEALLAFRAVTDHRIQAGIRPSNSALRHLPYHLAASFDLALDPVSGQDLRFQNEMFQVAQWASTTVAGGALNDAIARNQAEGEAAVLLREKQFLARKMAVLHAAINRATYDGLTPGELLQRLSETETRHAALNRQINLTSPKLTSLAGFEPLRMEDVASTLGEDELIVMFTSSDVTPAGDRAGSFVIALGRENIFVGALPSREALTELSHQLRCSAALTDPNCAGQGDRQTRGSFSMAPETPAQGLAFETDLAHEAYNVLFAPLGALLMKQKKRLIIVPDQALISLPFHLTLQTPLAPDRPLKEGNWLIRDHSIEVIPSISSFVAMRDADHQSEKPERFLGVGDPLIGVQRRGAIPFNCGDADATIFTASADIDALKRGLGSDRTQAVGNLQALPDTRCELQQIAGRFGNSSTLLLNERASEVELKLLSEAGQLRDYSVISFATHGLVAGEIGINESGLVLTPPDLPTLRDDGLLTTQEIAALDLDAEFVILSACNTASGDTQNTEGLSGMASAFFFAGARSLLVSHWPVYSDAAVDLTTRSFEALKSDRAMARADAIRLAMLAVLDHPNATPRQQHPSYWGPFMIVGDGLGQAGSAKQPALKQ